MGGGRGAQLAYAASAIVDRRLALPWLSLRQGTDRAFTVLTHEDGGTEVILAAIDHELAVAGPVDRLHRCHILRPRAMRDGDRLQDVCHRRDRASQSWPHAFCRSH